MKFLKFENTKLNVHNAFFLEARLFNACFPIFDSSILFLGIGQTRHFAVVLLSPRMGQDLNSGICNH